MRNILCLLSFLGLMALSCNGKKSATSTDTVDQKVIEKVERENVELESLEADIEDDIKEIDDLLNDIEG